MISIGKKYNNYLWYCIGFFSCLSFYLPIRSFFLGDFLWFWFQNAAIITAISMITTALFEVPSWSWADIYWRKKVMTLWSIILIVTTSTYLWATNFRIYIWNELIRWLWGAMISWCLVSLMYERYEENKKTNEFKKYSRIYRMMCFLWRLIWFPLAWYFYVMNPYFPYWALVWSFVVMTAVTLWLIYSS